MYITLSAMSSFGEMSAGIVPMARMQLVSHAMTIGLSSGLVWRKVLVFCRVKHKKEKIMRGHINGDMKIQ